MSLYLLKIMARQKIFQLMYRQIGGVNNPISPPTQLMQPLSLDMNAIENGRLRKQRMRAPRLRKSANENFISCLQEQEVHGISQSLQRIKIAEEIGEEFPLANIHAQRNVLDVATALHAQLRESRKEGGGQIIDAKKPEILKTLDGVSLP
jgi:hypothetical protein